MQGIGWFLAIILGALAGWIAEKLMGADHGLLTNILLGIVGALLGNFLLTTLTDGTLTGVFGQLIVAVIGACILILIGRALRRG
ncbi:MAG: GlsB/YeaQ/YmgE family stress response membrane protein [Roseicyclus sp.]